MSTLRSIMDGFRQGILLREGTASRELLNTYLQVYKAIGAEADEIAKKVVSLQKAGKPISESLLYRETRLEQLLSLLRQEVSAFADHADTVISQAQTAAVLAGDSDSLQIIEAALGPLPMQYEPPSFLKPNFHAAQELVGRLQDGTPLRRILQQLPGEAVNIVKESLVKGIVTGQGPKKAALEMKAQLNIPLTRAMTISRTETMSAYREAQLQSYQANNHVVKKWRWTASLSLRSCPMCIAMDGQVFDASVPFGSHPNCRCAPVPVTVSWADLGIPVPDSRPQWITGEQWFNQQPEKTQREILGPGRFDRLKSGDFSLQDLVGYRDDEEWGPTRWTKSLKELDQGRNRRLGGELSAAR